jgi:hypothetical protein
VISRPEVGSAGRSRRAEVGNGPNADVRSDAHEVSSSLVSGHLSEGRERQLSAKKLASTFDAPRQIRFNKRNNQ